eukprot:jgi/Mesvir1/4920/Mv14586-RA.2
MLRKRVLLGCLLVLLALWALLGPMARVRQHRLDAAPSGASIMATTLAKAWPRCTPANAQAALSFRPGRLHDSMPRMLAEYARFHRKSLEDVASGAESGHAVRFLVFTCQAGRCGGYGDRFKGMADALYLAIVTRRVLLIQHPSFPLTDSLVPHGIDWHTWAHCADPYVSDGPTVLNALHPPPRYMVKGKHHMLSGVFDGERLVTEASDPSVRSFHLLTNVAAWNEILDCPRAAANMGAVTGSPWAAPQGPRFAWAWHFLFRPTPVLKAAVAGLRARLGIPGDGTPWVGVHMRTGSSEDFKDKQRNAWFCDVGEGARHVATCTSRIAQLVSQITSVRGGAVFPRLALPQGTTAALGSLLNTWSVASQGKAGDESAGVYNAGKPLQKAATTQGSGRPLLDPHSIPIFVASDNQDAIAAFHEGMVRLGHSRAAVLYTDDKVIHADNITVGGGDEPQRGEIGSGNRGGGDGGGGEGPMSAPRQAMVRTLAEMLLLSQATCVVAGRGSGFSGMAILLSRDLVTGARCYTFNSPFPDAVCGDEADLLQMTFRTSNKSGAAFRADQIVPPGSPIRKAYCSAIVMHGGALCRQPLSFDLVFRATMTGPDVGLVSRLPWIANEFQQTVATTLGLSRSCLIDILIGDKSVAVETLDVTRQRAPIAMTITVHVEGGEAQREELIRATNLDKQLALFKLVGKYMKDRMPSGVVYRMSKRASGWEDKATWGMGS